MELKELRPQWHMKDGVRNHIAFDCPVCKTHRIEVPVPPHDNAWSMQGESFEDLSLNPSILHETHYADSLDADPRFCRSHFFVIAGKIQMCE